MRAGLALLSGLVLGLSIGAARAQAPLPGPPRPALAQPAPPPASPLLASMMPVAGPGLQCRAAIRAAERAAGIPHQLMAAIGRVESGRREADGSVNPWPWSIDAEGGDHVFESKAEAVAAVRALQAKGMRSIDVGCMQVNLLHHPDAFPTLEQAFDPVANANYAAQFLLRLKDQTGTWPTATAWYHSATPELGADYERRVMAVLPEEQNRPDDAPRPTVASTYANGYASGFTGGFANNYMSGFAYHPGGAGRVGGGYAPPRADTARIIPLAAGAAGRSLAAYRAAPIQAAPMRAAPLPPPPRAASTPG